MKKTDEKMIIKIIDKYMNLNNLMIDTLEEYNNKKKEEGFIPTVDMLIEELKEIEVRDEAKRLTQQND